MKIMKKIAVAVFAGAMVFGFASCGDTVGETGKIGKDINLTNGTTTNYQRGTPYNALFRSSFLGENCCRCTK